MGDNPLAVEVYSTFTDPGVTITDNVDKSLTATVTGSVDTSIIATYILKYNVSDSAGNAATEVSRSVVVSDTTPPEITLLGDNPLVLAINSTFTDPGATVSDNFDTGLTATVTGTVNTSVLGSYTLSYNVSDSSSNAATSVTRKVDIVDTTAPVITLIGANPLAIEGGSVFTDPGATVTDNVDTGLTASVSGTVDTSTVGSYTLTYDVSDNSGNAASSVTRTVNVEDTTAPVITLVGDDPMVIELNSVFSDPGTTVIDNIDSGLTTTVTGVIDTAALGSTILTYNVSDNAGNAATAVTRTVKVVFATPIPTLTIGMKQLQFSWPAVDGADHYRILVNPDGLSGFTVDPDATNISATSHTLVIPVHLTNWLSAQYIVEVCDAAEVACVGSLSEPLALLDSVAATGYVKASNTDAGDLFGLSVSLSADGNTLAVGAYFEGSAATGIDGNELDNSKPKSGAAYVYQKSGLIWEQQAYIKASNTDAGDYFARSVVLSGDGNTLAVGAFFEDSSATGIGGNQSGNTAEWSGAVYVYLRTGTAWAQQAYLKASNTDADDRFGLSLDLNENGNTLAVGSFQEDSSATGVGGIQLGNTSSSSGAVYVFLRSGSTWAQQAYVKASNTGDFDYFGISVALSDDGNTLAVGADGEASAATGVEGNQSDNSVSQAGAAYVFLRSGAVWIQQAYIKASNTNAGDNFGRSVAISGDGNTLAVGAYWEESAATGVDGDQLNNSAAQAGAVYTYLRESGVWSQQAYLKASNTGATDYFGFSVALSIDGNTLAVGGYHEAGATKGVGGNLSDNTAPDAGAVYTYQRSGTIWSPLNYVKAANTDQADSFGISVSLSSDGNTLAVGAYMEESAATGIGGNQSDNTANDSGAVYLF